MYPCGRIGLLTRTLSLVDDVSVVVASDSSGLRGKLLSQARVYHLPNRRLKLAVYRGLNRRLKLAVYQLLNPHSSQLVAQSPTQTRIV